MNFEDLKAALAPFARFAELFTHNTLGVDYENFYSKSLTINGQDREFKITGADFDRAKDALDFLNKVDPSKQPQAGPEHDPNVPMVELKGAQGAAEVTETDGHGGATEAELRDAEKAIHETKQEPMPEPTKKGKGK